MKFLFILGLLCWSISTYATDRMLEIQNQGARQVSAYEYSPTETSLLIEYGFGGTTLNLPKDFAVLKAATITRVEMVYTRNTNPNFDQKGLNEARLKALQKILSSAFEDEMVHWVKVSINGEQSVKEVRQKVHGFVITYRIKPTKASMEKEIAFLKGELTSEVKASFSERPAFSMVKREVADSSSEIVLMDWKYYSPITSSYLHYCNAVNSEFDTKVPVYPGKCKSLKRDIKSALENVMLKSPFQQKQKLKLHFGVDSTGKAFGFRIANWRIFPKDSQVFDNLEKLSRFEYDYSRERDHEFEIDFGFIVDEDGLQIKFGAIRIMVTTKVLRTASNVLLPSLLTYTFQDSSVFKFFKRHKQLSNSAIVCDVTGSMSPYTKQVLDWQKMYLTANPNAVSYFCLFNDGDLKPQSLKFVGNTGGLYAARIKQYKQLEKLMITAMSAGGGGDCPENNFEACLKAQKDLPDCKEIIMIADNWAVPRDVQLMRNLRVPVRFVMCGAQGGINTQYLDLARQCGGSIHTIESDIMGLTKMAEGETIKIDGKQYRLIRGKFVRL